MQYRLLQENDLPDGFTYPRAFRRALDLELTNLEPWYVIEGDALQRTFAGLQARFPERKLIPFARRQDNDDIACWSAGQESCVFIVHDFATAGWERREEFVDFWAWFRRAIEDMIAFDP